jgi:hypothetical protein
MNLFSHYLLAKIYWPIDLLGWALVLLIIYLPYIRYCADREIKLFLNFVYFFLFFAITIPSTLGWLWLIRDGIIAVWQSGFVKLLFLALGFLFFLYIIFEDFIKESFTRKRFDANLKPET